MSEIELAKEIIQELTLRGWEVYQEVEIARGSGIADIVGVHGQLVWVVECKTSVSLALLDQIQGWCGLAHYKSIATYYPSRHSRGQNIACNWLRQHGVGWFQVYRGRSGLEERPSPRLDRRAGASVIRNVLCEEHKVYAEAGNPNGSRWTPFQWMCGELRRTVEQHPGMTLREVCDTTRHHYSSTQTFRSCLRRYLAEGIIKGIRIEGERPMRLYLIEEIKR